MVRAIYSTGLSIYIHGITSAKRTCEVRPSLLVREGNMLFVRYSLDTRARYSTYSLNFESQKGSHVHRDPEFSHNYLIDYTIGFIIITHNYLITAKK